MALARIITRSEACSRELAADLLSRGYTVEVVPPDAVPTHRADLELRVEAKSGEKLTANVVVRDGDRSTSLDFVRDLSVPAAYPVPDASSTLGSAHAHSELPVPAASGSAAASSVSARFDPRDEASVRSVTKPDSSFDYQDSLIPMAGVNRWNSESYSSPSGIAIASSKIARLPVHPPIISRSVIASAVSDKSLLDQTAFNGAVLNQPTFEKVSPAAAVAKRPPTPARPILAAIMQSRFAQQISPRIGIITASLASLGLLLVLVLALRSGRTSVTARQGSSPNAVGNLSSSTVSNPAATRVAGRSIASLKPAPVIAITKPAAKPASITKASVTKTPAAQTNAAARKRSTASTRDLRRHTDDLIARDTVTYLDRPARKTPKSAPTSAETAPRAHKRHNGEIAENSVTYLNGMTAPSASAATKPAK